jgi:5,10-methylenetetrahydrofolate reductase
MEESVNFREKLGSGKFVITGEISPPKGTDIQKMLNEAFLIKDRVDAINITDNQRAIMRMSPLAACSILKSKGFETIMHMTCRDRNRLSLQSELLGAGALGINNVLVMSGDHPAKGDHQGAKPVYDLDPVQLLGLIQKLNVGFDLSDNDLAGRPEIFPGAVANTQISELSLIKLEKKLMMGAKFIQTQAVFEVDKFSDFMRSIDSFREIFDVKIIAGIIPLRSEKSVRFLNENIAGISIPNHIIDRMKKAEYPKELGMEIASGTIQELRSMCDGVHIMPIVSHENTGQILEMSGIS